MLEEKCLSCESGTKSLSKFVQLAQCDIREFLATRWKLKERSLREKQRRTENSSEVQNSTGWVGNPREVDNVKQPLRAGSHKSNSKRITSKFCSSNEWKQDVLREHMVNLLTLHNLKWENWKKFSEFSMGLIRSIGISVFCTRWINYAFFNFPWWVHFVALFPRPPVWTDRRKQI